MWGEPGNEASCMWGEPGNEASLQTSQMICTLECMCVDVYYCVGCRNHSNTRHQVCHSANRFGVTLSALNAFPLQVLIRESVDSLCRDGADAQYMQYLRLRDTEVGVVSGPDGPPLGGCVR